MKKSISRSAAVDSPPALPRLGVAEAKGRLSEVLRGLAASPVVIQSRGHDVAVIVDVEAWARLSPPPVGRGGGARFVDALPELRARWGQGVEGFDPAPADLRPREPFGRRRR